MMPGFIQFSDKMVTYDTFMNDLAERVAASILRRRSDPEYVSQRQAYKIFGRANVDRWRKTGKITPHVRPGKIEYLTSELRDQQRQQQDHLSH